VRGGARRLRHSRPDLTHLLTSVVREICTLRSVGAGSGHPPSATRWATSDGCPYPDQQLSEVSAGNRLVPCHPLVERDRPGTLIVYAATLDLRMFWLIRKKFVGSYLFFSFTSRS
jgi:hypothetical protein